MGLDSGTPKGRAHAPPKSLKKGVRGLHAFPHRRANPCTPSPACRTPTNGLRVTRVDGATFGKVRASGRLPGPSGGAPMAGAVSARPGAVSKAPKGAIEG
ncbi:hypothetical protein PCANC_18035 [Puccinia coronata f. sp. avenae]|uniref:Uncharacterized protein n=1 Tax=Puccinia coronata f. sp. avenae TaxID=200324 RepID=A0A2N5SS26_9BASI|nr:hypothetical protein PCANC_18035 [Puccinia coronata f. sp. avenae]